MSSEQEQVQEDVLADLTAQFGEGGLGDVAAKPDANSIPKCTAIVKATNAYLNRSQKGRKQLTMVVEILSCDLPENYVGATFFKNWGLETETNLQWLYGDLASLEIAPPKLPADLIKIANQLQQIPAFKVSFVPNVDPQYGPNMYINKGALSVDIGISTAGNAATSAPKKDAF